MTIFVKTPVTKELPSISGKYIVFTESGFGSHFKSEHQFSAKFNGKNFEVNNQIVTDWLKEYKLSEINLVGNTIVLPL
jgi:hypothetical protein